MTDYELIMAFLEYLNAQQTTLMNYVAVLFAFLIAAYLIADKLQTGMVVIIVGLFTLVALPQVINATGVGGTALALAGQITARAAQDSSSIGWHPAATALGSIGLPIYRTATIIVIILSYIGGLIFFFHQRHVGRVQ